MHLNDYTVFMYSIIVQVYRFGVKRDERDLANDRGHAGRLQMMYMDGHLVLTFAGVDDYRGDNHVLPKLFEPKCIGWTGDMMLWRGVQRQRMKNPSKPAPAFLQEWRVRLVDRKDIEKYLA
jgi:hypothetical protein